MKARFPLSILVVTLIAASAPVRADMLTGLLVDAGSRLLSKAARATVATVTDAVTPKETDEERKAREAAEIEKVADQMLSQHPEEEREARRPEVVARLTEAYARYKAMEARQEAMRAAILRSRF